MKQRFLVSAAALLIGSAALSAPAMAQDAENIKLTIFGVGDIYNFADDRGRGGFARVNAVARAERANNPNTLYVFDGAML